MRIDDYFSRLVDQFTPTLDSYEQGVQRADRIGKILRRDPAYGVLQFKVVGSCQKETAIFPVEDVDIILYLDESRWRSRRGTRYGPATLLGELEKRLAQTYRPSIERGTVKLRRQAHSVRIVYTQSPQSIDVVPAFWLNANPHYLAEIPERGTRRWIQTSVVRQLASLNRLDNASHFLRRGIRLLKLWRNHHRLDGLPSYALEILAMHACGEGCVQEEGSLFRHVLQRIVRTNLQQTTCIPGPVLHSFKAPRRSDPIIILDAAVKSNNVTSNTTSQQRFRIVEKAKLTLALLLAAEEASEQGRERVALARLKKAIGAVT